MVDFKIKGMLNHHLKIANDCNNFTNGSNLYLFSQMIEGNFKSPAYDYLNNLGFMRLNDIKSLAMYNETNFAAKMNESKEYEEIKDDNTILLPKPIKKIKRNITEVMEQRHSSREFDSIQMKLDEFSSILKYAFGLSARKANYNGVIATTRHYGSGGGLYPIDVYILVNNVNSLKKGVYKYQPYSHSLYPIRSNLEIEKLLEYGAFDFNNYSFCVLYEYDMDKNYMKYGELSLAITLIEVGLMSQNFDLITTALNYSACEIAGFNKQYAEKELSLDGLNSHILFTNICGKE